MATRSSIAVKLEDGSYRGIYAHWDGYPSHNGRLLFEHYNSYDKALALVSIGDLSSLAESIEKPEGHSFDTPVKGFTTFYGRDRDEPNTEPKNATTYPALMRKLSQEYDYLFDDGQWWVIAYNSERRPLAEVLADGSAE